MTHVNGLKRDATAYFPLAGTYIIQAPFQESDFKMPLTEQSM